MNGKIAREYTWPWMAEIVYNNEHYCGAVLISDDVLLTAAHCLYHRESRLYVDDIEIRIGTLEEFIYACSDNRLRSAKPRAVGELFRKKGIQET